MGTSTSGSFSHVAGGGKLVKARLNDVFKAVDSNLPAQVAVGTAIGALAAANPVVSAAIAGYQAAKLSSEAISAGQRTYERTSDSSKALQAAGMVIAKGAVEVVADQALSTAVDVGWSALKSKGEIATSLDQDRLIISAVKSTVEEGARTWLKKERKS